MRMKFYLIACFVMGLMVWHCKGQSIPTIDTIAVHAYQSLTDSAHAAALRGDTDTSLQFHKHALAHARKHGMQEHQAHALINIARLLKNDDAGQSLSYLRNALQIAERLHKHELRADILLAMSGIYKQQQNYREALTTLEAHQALLQKVFEKNKVQETARLRAGEARALERAVFITVLIAVLILAGFFAWHYHRTKRLNRALQQSNQIKDTLFSIIGHDLRGPAGNIMQALEMVDAGLLDEAEEQEVISLLKDQSRSFNETLNNLLNWAAAQLKGAQPHIASVDALTSIRKTLELLNAQAAAKGIRINVPNEEGLSIMADSDQLDFVVRNLVSNAIKFSYPGGQIDIAAKKQENTAVISVQDNGKGIPTDQQAYLFSAGKLKSTFGTKGEKGTGLGLMLTWDFIRANRGRIWFDSKEGAGTTFYVSLPLAS
jgi:signal transduction histidine kinase